MSELRKEEIERLERRLLKANRVSSKELREIVSAPQLFDKINARIREAQAARTAEAVSGRREKPPVWSLVSKIGFAFGALTIFLVSAIGLIFFLKADFSVSPLTETVAAPKIENQTASVEPPDMSGKTEDSNAESRTESKKIALKNRLSQPARRASVVTSRRKLPTPPGNQPEEAFYPLAFAENLEEAKEAGQVIRVELSRSSLLALGVNPPTDDENLKVKTDLLLGSDGVARGIRFVK